MRVPSFVRAAGVLALGFAVTTPTSAAALRLTCRDGDPNIVVSPRGLGAPPFYNHDEPGDEVCTFAICSGLSVSRAAVWDRRASARTASFRMEPSVPVWVLWTVSRPSHAAASIFARTSRGVQWPWRSTSHSAL